MTNRWVVLIGSAVALMVSYSPAIQQTFGIYLKPIAASFGWTRTTIALVYSLTPLVSAPLMIVVGGLVDRIGNRPVILGQAFGLPLLLILYSYMQPSLSMFILLICLGGVVSSGSTPASINSVLMQWFDRRLGLALGLSMAALGIGTSIMPPLVSHWIGLWGWRGAFRAEAALIGVIGIINALLLIWDNPTVLRARAQTFVRGESGVGTAGKVDGLSIKEVLATVLFWRISGCFFLMGLMFAGVSVHFVPMMTDWGIPSTTAADFFGLMGLAQIVGRLVCAAIVDRIRVIPFAAAAYLLATVAFGLLAIHATQAVYLAPVCLGLAAGVVVHAMGMIVRRWFGLRAAGRVFSMCFTAFVVGSALGPLIMAFAYDRTGTYQIPLDVFTALSIGVAWIFHGVHRYPQVAPRPDAAIGEITVQAMSTKPVVEGVGR